MESTLKVYVYREGQRPIMHTPTAVLKGIYASEGWFMKQLEDHNKFVTKDPQKAHLYYLPFSSRMLRVKLYVQKSHSRTDMVQYLQDYLDLIAGKYPFWNRTGGADHFLVACHDWVCFSCFLDPELLRAFSTLQKKLVMISIYMLTQSATVSGSCRND